jgi:TPR repeat protein
MERRQGHAVAEVSLGLIYNNNYNGVPQDFTEAVKWFRKAADQGYAKAQALLGSMYFLGHGVPQDNTEAVKWFRMAADQGEADAQAVLGHYYRDGQDTPQDYAEAVKWYRLSA